MTKPDGPGSLNRFTLVTFIMFLLVPALFSQEDLVNYDENKVPDYTLPDPLMTVKGKAVTDSTAWWNERRPEILSMFEQEEYGMTPQTRCELSFEVVSADSMASGGKAFRKEIRIYFSRDKKGPSMLLLMYLPKKRTAVPVVLGLNFDGNHTITDDPGITLTDSWKESEHERGEDSLSWPVESILARGFGLATIYYGDIDPDFDDGFRNGVHPLFYGPGQTKPGPGEWGSIGAWAWGLSRALDYLETDKTVDPKKVMLVGHSRLGKAALWAGAQDRRFAIVVSNNSGCGGAALSKRIFGETVAAINKTFPHWFCSRFKYYSNNETALPFDQHMLIALIAPRPVYVASAEEDRWADPKGEFLGALNADPVYKLLGAEGLPVNKMPQVNTPVMGTIGYHIRSGGHDIISYDWERYLDFAEKHFR